MGNKSGWGLICTPIQKTSSQLIASLDTSTEINPSAGCRARDDRDILSSHQSWEAIIVTLLCSLQVPHQQVGSLGDYVSFEQWNNLSETSLCPARQHMEVMAQCSWVEQALVSGNRFIICCDRCHMVSFGVSWQKSCQEYQVVLWNLEWWLRLVSFFANICKYLLFAFIFYIYYMALALSQEFHRPELPVLACT